MTLARIFTLALLTGLLGASPALSDKIVPRAGQALAPLPTDEAVRRGMIAIRDLVRTNHSLITHRRMPPDHALRFAVQVKVEADRMLATTSLTGDAREKLRALLDDIVAGLGAVAKPTEGTTAMDGLARADAALSRYPEAFDHPGWQPLQSLD